MSAEPPPAGPGHGLVRLGVRGARGGVRAGATMWHRLRRLRLVLGIRLRAVWLRASVDCHVARDLRQGRRVRVTVAERSRSTLRIGERCIVGEGTAISLRGGELVLGRGVELRRGCQLEISGRLELEGPVLVQHGTTLHCDESIRIGPRAVLSEYVTVVDSSHGTDEGEGWFLDVVRTRPVVVGAGAWVGAKATIAKGVSVGDGSVVSANSLVVKDVPARWLVSGVPATPVRRLGDDEHPSEALVGGRPVA